MILLKSSNTFLDTNPSQLIKLWRENPVIAANHLLIRDGSPVILAPVQEIILMEWWTGKFSLLTASRGSGKSFLSAVYIALTCMLYPGTKVGIFAPAFRQSKFIFNEFTKLFQESPFLQQVIDKEPTLQTDQCITIFKSPGRGREGSVIKALPVGSDGGKIRGERFKRVLLDEIVHLPESIFRSAIHPMMSTSVNPMQKVKQIEKLRNENVDLQLIENLLEGDAGYIGITSGYYQFNYWWKEIIAFYERIKSGSPNYKLRFVPYYELPEGFYNTAVVEDAKLNAPSHMFMTEWMADWISDSDGAFPMSLLESCRDPKVEVKYARSPDSDKGKEFIFGIDTARESDSTAVCVMELGFPSKVVFLVEIEDKPFAEQAKMIFELIERFNPVRIYMDPFGGGNVIKDHLEDPQSVGASPSQKIIEIDQKLKKTGKAILELKHFNTEFIEEANNNTKTLLEQRAVRLPTADHPIESIRKSNIKSVNKEVDLVQELINQVASVVVTQTPGGKLHYDLPKKKGTNSSLPSSTVSKKDLYTSFILASKCVYDLQWKPREDKTIVEIGVIKQINTSASPLLTGGQGIDIIQQRGRPPSIVSPNNGKNIVIPGGGIILSRNVRRRK